MKQPEQLSQDDVLLNQLSQIVLDNLENEQFSVETLAEAAGMSRSYLYRKLKLLKGHSISQFIRGIRLEEALALLRQDVGTASEIAYRVGFNSSSYFHRCFLERYGYPPSEAKNGEGDPQLSKPPVPIVSATESAAEPHHYTGWKPIGMSIAGLLLLLGLGYWVMLPKEPVAVPTVGRSIAVLPFASLSEEVENQHFADGLVEDLLSRLSVVQQFKVISRTSSDTYRERGLKTLPEIAEELDVAYIVEGSVQRKGNKIRITIQLIDAEHDHHQWAQSFDRELGDVFGTQSEIAMRVASELQAVLTPQQAQDIRKSRTENIRAFELYQLGRYFWNKRTKEGYHKAIDYFEQAISEDPGYGLAYAGLADTYYLLTLQHEKEKEVGINQAVEMALKALELDEDLAEAHTVLASISTYIEYDWQAAESAYLKAIELNPNYSTAHHYYAEHLNITGRPEEARKHINKAIELDPLSSIIRYISGALYFDQGRFTESLSEVQICQHLNNDHPWLNYSLFYLNWQLGNDSLALEAFKLRGIETGNYNPHQADSAYQSSGFEGLEKWIAELTPSLFYKSFAYGLLRDDERAISLLEQGIDEGNYNPTFASCYHFKHLHSDPRFVKLLNRIGLPWTPADSL